MINETCDMLEHDLEWCGYGYFCVKCMNRFSMETVSYLERISRETTMAKYYHTEKRPKPKLLTLKYVKDRIWGTGK